MFKVSHEEVAPAKVAPAEVEHLLSQHPSVAEAAIVPTAHRRDATSCKVRAYVAQKKKRKKTEQGYVDYVAENLSVHKAPTGGVTFIEQVPRNAMKKVIARELPECTRLPGSVDYL